MKIEEKSKEEQKKYIGKAYGEYMKKFTPKPKYVLNGAKAFLVGGSICSVSLLLQNVLIDKGMTRETAATWVTIILVITAQTLTGLGVFDTLGKKLGAGVIVPITGFANSMVAPAIEFKKEGYIMGIGSKLFSIAGPVLVCGIVSSTLIGVVYYFMGKIF